MELKLIFVFLKKHSSARSATDNEDFLFRLLCVNITSHNPPLFRRCEMLSQSSAISQVWNLF